MKKYNKKEPIDANVLLTICKQRREKTAKELGYSNNSDKLQPYRSVR